MIKQSVLNSFKRVGIDETIPNDVKSETAMNRFSGETVIVSPLIARCIKWVYNTSNAYERGDFGVKVSDFDRIRYFVLAEDSKAYMICLD